MSRTSAGGPPGAGATGRRAKGLRSHLLVLLLAVLVPLSAFAAVVAGLLLRDQRAAVERGLAETASIFALAVDRELEGVISTLQTLGTSPSLRRGDLPALYRQLQAVRAEAHPDWSAISLVDPSGQVLLSTAVPEGTRLAPVGDRPYFRDAIARRRPVVSDLIAGRLTGEQVIVVAVPVRVGEDVRHVLLATIPIPAWSAFLSERALPAGWAARLIDGADTTLARNPPGGAEQFVGVRAPRDLAALVRDAERGWVRFTSRTGRPVYAVSRRSALSGWLVTVALPADQVDAAMWRSFILLAGGGLALAGAGIGLAAVMARRIGRRIDAVRRAARAIGRGEVPALAPARIRELDEIGATMVETGALLRTAEEERQRLLLQSLSAQAEAEVFADLARTINQTLDLDRVLQELAGAAARLCGADAAFVGRRDLPTYLYTEGTFRRLDASGLGVGVAAEIGARVLETGRPARTEHDAGDPRLAAAEGGPGPAGEIVAAAAVPIRGGKHADGVLGVCNRSPRPFSERDQGLLVRLSDHAAIAIRNAEAFRREQASRAESDALAHVAQALVQSLDPAVVAQRVVDSVNQLLDGLVSVVYRLDHESGELVSLAVCGDTGPGFAGPVVFPRGTGVVGLALEARETVFSPDCLADPRVTLPPDLRRQLELSPHRAVLAVPLVVQGRVFGVMAVGSPRGRVFPDAGVALARAFAGHAAVALDNAMRYEAERAARAAAESANEVKNQFVAMLGHELRNPLGAISNAVAVLAQIGPADEPATRMRDVIARQTRHLTRLMDDLLDVSRLESGKIVLRREPVDLAETVRRCLATLDREPPTHRVSVHAEAVVVDGDPTRLEQVIYNLLDNALKYTPPGGTVAVAVERHGAEAVLRVRDSGVGIPPELLRRVFEPFVQAEISLDRARGGLGLGLALVKRIAGLHGGSVSASSDGPGRGSEFVVRLPILARPAPAAPPPALPDAVGALRIVLVEDHQDAREGLRFLLERMGHRVEVAEDGPAGRDLLLATRPDVGLVDLGLPGLDGYALAREVRGRGALAATYLIALTGYGQPADRRRSAEAGFDAHLVKPVEAEALGRVLAAVPRRLE